MPRAPKGCHVVDCRKTQPCPVHPKKVWARNDNWAPLPGNWSKIVKIVKSLYKNKCSNCGSSDHVEVDHIVGRAEAKRRGWTPEQMHRMSNLQLLCKGCHHLKTISEQRAGRAAARKPRG